MSHIVLDWCHIFLWRFPQTKQGVVHETTDDKGRETDVGKMRYSWEILIMQENRKLD